MFLTLHAARLRGRASTEAVGAAVGPGVDELLQAAVEAGHLIHKEGRAAGWSLTPAGREAHQALLATERESSGASDGVRAAYDEFLAVNPDLIQVCTDWQVKPDGALNDHADPGYDAGVIDTLATIDGRVQPVCARLGDQVVRFGGYGPRLSAALARVRAGDGQWFTSPAVESYHTVWFELHEDLLQTLGINRSDESQ
jgi:hypothetical protein